MTFSVQHNPYFPMYPGLQLPPSDSGFAQKALALRSSFDSRLQGCPNLDLLNSILATCVSAKTARNELPKLPYPPLGSVFSSPAWFHQALAAFQSSAVSLPKQLPEDLSMPINCSKASDNGHHLPLRIPRKPLTSPGYKCKPQGRSQNGSLRPERPRMDPLLYCQPTFYPILKDQVERAHQSWKTSDGTRVQSSLQFHETGTLVPSLIDGEVIMGFNVWGEKRLCLPHLFRFVLNDVDLKAIDEACTKLQITCTTCSPAQLTLLHARKILPQAVSSCGLIRKSDAERLTKFIRNRVELDKSSTSCSHSDEPNKPKPRQAVSACFDADGGDSDTFKYSSPTATERSTVRVGDGVSSRRSKSTSESVDSDHLKSPLSCAPVIPVIHECFGSQLGLIHPDRYTEATAKCIECQTCHRFFTTDQFVGHTHKVTEVDNLNHWGFDSSNWRCYLRLYSGKRSFFSVKNDVNGVRTQADVSDDELSEHESAKSFGNTAEAHRRLEEFKVKFAQPIRLPASLSAALRTVGLCASVAPIPPQAAASASQDLPNCPETGAPSLLKSFGSSSGSKTKELPGPASNTSATQPLQTPPVPTMMLPQLTLRRLWAPNDGCIRVPPPPSSPLRSTLVNTALPKQLNTGPPLLLNSRRVISQTAADQYDRDFIPNVCLMPPLKSKSSGIYRHHRARGSGGCSGSSSRSRSDSRQSLDSGGLRTSSMSSLSSTSSSCCSYPGKIKRRCNGLTKSSRNASSCSSSEQSIRVDDDCKSSYQGKLQRAEAHLKPRSHSWSYRARRRSPSNQSGSFYSDSVVNAYTRQLSKTNNHKRRHSFSALSNLFVDNTIGTCGSVSIKPGSKHKSKHRGRGSHRYSGHHGTYCQNRALAAAKAAQGAASRISPGLWSRHFETLNGLTRGPLNLPNAREPPVAQPETAQPIRQSGSLPSQLSQHTQVPFTSNTPVLVTSPNKNSLPTAVLALEAVWADLVRHINDYTVAVESRCGVGDARQRLFEQFIAMQTCYATHIASLMKENQSLNEQLISLKNGQSKHESVRYGTPTTDSSEHITQGKTAHSVEGSTKPAAPLKIYPHRNRKEQSRSVSEQRLFYSEPKDLITTTSKEANVTAADSSRDFADYDPIMSTATEHPLFPNYSKAVPQHRYAVSPIYTTSSSDGNTTQVSTPTASDPDGLQSDEKQLHTEDHSPIGFRVERLSNSAAAPPSAFSIKPSAFKQRTSCHVNSQEDNWDSPCGRTVDREDRAAPDNARSSPDITLSLPPPAKRRSLLPPCESRPRLTLKPQPRPPV